MKQYNKILEAINRGIQLALDDYQDIEDNNSISSDIINTQDIIQNKIILNKYTVDLGLPSGTRWCKYNLGCDYDLLNNHPEDSEVKNWYGDYYAWGEIKPNKPEGYRSETYKFYNYTNDGGLYITKYYCGINDIILYPEDDVAYQKMNIGDLKFHIPTKEQCEELLKYTEQSEFIENYSINGKEIKGLNGWEFTSKINKNKLFIPASGSRSQVGLNRNGEHACIWSSTLYDDNIQFAQYLDVDRYDAMVLPDCRDHGLVIRPVINLK